jgi:hypothetical protein
MHLHLLCMKETTLPIQIPSKKAREKCMHIQIRKGNSNHLMIPQDPKVENQRKGRPNVVTATTVIIMSPHA